MNRTKWKVLVIEDVFSNRLILERLLTGARKVIGCESGEAGIESFCREYLAGEPFELVLVDLSLPGISGVAVVEQIRSFEAESELQDEEQVKIVVITSSDDALLRQQVLDNGADCFITKPVEAEKLYQVLNDLGFSSSSTDESE